MKSIIICYLGAFLQYRSSATWRVLVSHECSTCINLASHTASTLTRKLYSYELLIYACVQLLTSYRSHIYVLIKCVTWYKQDAYTIQVKKIRIYVDVSNICMQHIRAVAIYAILAYY